MPLAIGGDMSVSMPEMQQGMVQGGMMSNPMMNYQSVIDLCLLLLMERDVRVRMSLSQTDDACICWVQYPRTHARIYLALFAVSVSHALALFGRAYALSRRHTHTGSNAEWGCQITRSGHAAFHWSNAVWQSAHGTFRLEIWEGWVWLWAEREVALSKVWSV